MVENCDIEEVDSFTYLDANVTKDGGSTADARKRIAMASGSFRRLDSIWKATESLPLQESGSVCPVVWM